MCNHTWNLTCCLPIVQCTDFTHTDFEGGVTSLQPYCKLAWAYHAQYDVIFAVEMCPVHWMTFTLVSSTLLCLIVYNYLCYFYCRCVELSCYHWRETSSMYPLHLHYNRWQESSAVWRGQYRPRTYEWCLHHWLPHYGTCSCTVADIWFLLLSTRCRSFDPVHVAC